MERGREDDDGDEHGEREGIAEPLGRGERGECERDDDEVELVDEREGGTALATGAAFEEGGEDVAEHRAEREREHRNRGELGERDADCVGDGGPEGVERDGERDAGEGADGGPAPRLAVAQQAAVAPGAAAVDGTAAAGEHGGVVRDVRGEHRPHGDGHGADQVHASRWSRTRQKAAGSRERGI